jgi:hypothetical protein
MRRSCMEKERRGKEDESGRGGRGFFFFSPGERSPRRASEGLLIRKGPNFSRALQQRAHGALFCCSQHVEKVLTLLVARTERVERRSKGKQTRLPLLSFFLHAVEEHSTFPVRSFSFSLFFPFSLFHSPARPGSAARARRWRRRSSSPPKEGTAAGAWKRRRKRRRDAGGGCLMMTLTTRHAHSLPLLLAAAPAPAPARGAWSCAGRGRLSSSRAWWSEEVFAEEREGECARERGKGKRRKKPRRRENGKTKPLHFRRRRKAAAACWSVASSFFFSFSRLPFPQPRWRPCLPPRSQRPFVRGTSRPRSGSWKPRSRPRRRRRRRREWKKHRRRQSINNA